jgi:hypothetical protein
MNSNYTSVVGLAIAMLLISGPTISQTAILDCSPNTLSLCVSDPGVSLPETNQLYVGVGTPGASSCSVHVRQTRTISSTCGGVILYSVALIIDTVQYFIQPVTEIQLDSTGQAVLVFDTRTADDTSIRQQGIPYNPGCGEEYAIQWYVDDECGGEAHCSEFLQVYDCQAPDVSVSTSLQTISVPVGCQLTVFAYDFILGILDDCLVADELLYSLSDTAYIPFQPLDYCALGLGIETSFPVWAADQGRDVNCNDTIEWSERNLVRKDIPVVIQEPGNCECFELDNIISGKVYTELQRPLDMVQVNLQEPEYVYPPFTTGPDGEYSFIKQGAPFEDVTIAASRNDNPRNGVSTLDVVKIQKHLLMIDTLESPYRIIAADANSSNSVTAIDLIELRKLILGIYDELPNSPSWKFIDAKYDFPDPFNPFDWVNMFPVDNPYTIIIPHATNLSGQDFIGVKVGDVNNTIRGNLQSVVVRNDPPVVELTTPEQVFVADAMIEIPIISTSNQALQGIQFTLDATGLEFVGVKSNACTIDDDAYFMIKDRITLSWYALEDVVVNEGDVLFTIMARATKPGSLMQSLDLNSTITEAELYDRQDVLYRPVLKITTSEQLGIQLLPAVPNPFAGVTLMPFYLQASAEVIMTVSSVDGKVLISETMQGVAGRNEFLVRADQIAASGILVISLQAGDEVQYQKVMLIR